MECFANVVCSGDRIGISIRPFRIDVDQAHLYCAERLTELAFTTVPLVTEPRPLRPPEQFLRFPGVLAAAGKTEGLESHRLECNIADQNEEIGPRDLRSEERRV